MGVGRHCRVRKGADEMKPVVEKPRDVKCRRNHKKGDAPVRLSWRVQGEDPSILDQVPKTPASKKLWLGR